MPICLQRTDYNLISLDNFNTLSSRQVMRIQSNLSMTATLATGHLIQVADRVTKNTYWAWCNDGTILQHIADIWKALVITKRPILSLQ